MNSLLSGLARRAAGREREVVVVQHGEGAVVEDHDVLDRLEREAEGLAEAAEPRGFAMFSRSATSVLSSRPSLVAVALVGQVDPLEHGGVALPVVPLDDQEPVRVDRDGVADRVGGGLQLVDPARAGVRSASAGRTR